MKRLTALGAILVVIVCVVVWIVFSSAPIRTSASTRILVEGLKLTEKKISVHEELPGRVVPFEVAEIRPQVTGIISDRLFVEGDAVTAGQQLYQIDPAPYEARLRSAEADLKKANASVAAIQAKANRFKELVEFDAVSKQDYDDISASLLQARADVGIAQAAVTNAEIELNYAKVIAPISGRIGKSLFTKGALVTANQDEALAKITKLNPVYLDLIASSPQLSLIREKLMASQEIPVEILSEEYRSKTHRVGKIQFADVTMDQTTGSVQLRAIFPNEDEFLLPGMFLRARVDLGKISAILIPQRASSRGPDGALRVWRIREDNTVEHIQVTERRAEGDSWLIENGVKTGDRIVVKGTQKLRPGAEVELVAESANEGNLPNKST